MRRTRRSPSQQREERRSAIVDAARRVLAADGFEGATIARIARKAGISTGLVYLYFTNREDLLAEVYRYASSHEVAAMTSAALGGTPAERFRAAVETFVRRAFRGRRLAYALIAEAADPVVVKERNQARQEFASVFEQIIEAGVAGGGFPSQDPHVRGAAVIGAINEAVVEALHPATAVEPSDGLIAEIVAAACAIVGIGAAPATAPAGGIEYPPDDDRELFVRHTKTRAGRQTRQAILEAAGRLFGGRGLAGVSVADIAAEAGVFPSQVTYYFRAKEALFVEAACREVQHVMPNARATGWPAERWARATAERALEGPGLMMFIEAILLARRRPGLAPAIGRTWERLHAEVADRVATEQPRAGPTAAARARAFWAAVLGSALARTISKGRDPAEAAIRLTLDLHSGHDQAGRE